jgi:hypothetical protein
MSENLQMMLGSAIAVVLMLFYALHKAPKKPKRKTERKPQ